MFAVQVHSDSQQQEVAELSQADMDSPDSYTDRDTLHVREEQQAQPSPDV